VFGHVSGAAIRVVVEDDVAFLEGVEPELGEWDELAGLIAKRSGEVEIALVGKYVKLHDAYLSVHEALKHSGIQHGVGVNVRWFDAEGMSRVEEQAKGFLVRPVLVTMSEMKQALKIFNDHLAVKIKKMLQ